MRPHQHENSAHGQNDVPDGDVVGEDDDNRGKDSERPESPQVGVEAIPGSRRRFRIELHRRMPAHVSAPSAYPSTPPLPTMAMRIAADATTGSRDRSLPGDRDVGHYLHMNMLSSSTSTEAGAGMLIRYAIVDSPLGRMLVAATTNGVCTIAMASSDADLERALSSECAAATLEKDDGSLEEWTGAILEHLAGARTSLDLPLDVQATAFQWQVWRALSAIPYGETRSYGEIAAAIGRPRRFAPWAARARRIRSPSRSPVTGCCRRQAASADIDGASLASRPCSAANAVPDDRRSRMPSRR